MKRLALTLIGGLLMTATLHAADLGDREAVQKEIAKFAPIEVKVDPRWLNAKEKKLVEKLVEAARVMDEIFLRQVWSGNVALKEKLIAAGEPARPFLDLFDIMKGPYDRLDHMKPFIAGVPPKPKGAGMYPDDITKAEFEDWVATHPADKEAFESNFTVIRRDAAGGLKAVPFSQEYAPLLKKAAVLLNEAATFADNASLRKYLTSRAQAFLSNDYYASDVDWVRLKDHTIEVVIGPYEVYEDELMGAKAAFEAFITRVDKGESERLAAIASMMPEFEQGLPVPEAMKGKGRNLSSPIVVTNELYTGGDAKRGVNTIAFNLPNDERVRKQEGSKKVLLKNIQEAKFHAILKPIAAAVLSEKDSANVDFDAFFAHTLLHEVSHGLGPGEITVNGRATTVGKELKDLYSLIEEAKADSLGLFENLYLAEKGTYPKDFARVLYPTYLAGIFRSVRFGIGEAHGGANAIQFNVLWEKGAITYDPRTKLFAVNEARFPGALQEMVADLITMEYRGDYATARRWAKKYKVLRPEMKDALARLARVPTDIAPRFSFE